MKLLILRKIDFVKKIAKRIKIKSFKKLLVLLYLIVMFIGLILSGLFIFIPKLYSCGKLMGLDYCTPTGVLTMMGASIPGYLIGGNLIKFLPKITMVESILLVFVVSLIFYYFTGWVIDKARKHELEPVKTIVISSLIILLFLILVLS